MQQLPQLVTTVRTVDGPDSKMGNGVMWFSHVEMKA
jgi:hypothetical protein